MFTAIDCHEHHTNTRRYARACFERFCQQGGYGHLWRQLIGRREALQNLHEVAQSDRVWTRSHAGVRLVPIDQIRGSEGRCNDFDTAFRPLKSLSDERWISIFCAHEADVPLPLVELIQVNDLYFVRDGHHRISVARWLGQREIEAEVTVWHCCATATVAQPHTAPARAAKRTAQQPNRLSNLLAKSGEWLLTVLQKVQPLVARTTMQGS